ncbi:YbaB/EbfC family nucleoid-associated protein [Nocardiopsis sp. CNT312]|uniref:YbaB/EbfC family nucleoid-associated protein n=1 Tax=Nocardiopsis sp. CNT312 TaxID=1137268 RepID=UPI001E3E544A|nr:YbaB/EbfC family nucleoid-associated protein [Nocardiopsis sp. CNT312]
MAEVDRANANLESATEEVVAKNRLVGAKVNGKGELVELKFHNQNYRDMAPAELADAIVDVINQARDRMSDRVAELYKPLMPEGLDAHQAMKGDFDTRAMFERMGLPLPPQ